MTASWFVILIQSFVDRYILLHKPAKWTDELRGKFMKFLDKFFYLLNCMQVSSVQINLSEVVKSLNFQPQPCFF